MESRGRTRSERAFRIVRRPRHGVGIESDRPRHYERQRYGSTGPHQIVRTSEVSQIGMGPESLGRTNAIHIN
eukprot:6065447-Pyramimonas_sp.AAC.1